MRNEDKEFEEKMMNITAPEIDSESRKRILKIALLNARRSAHIGMLLVALPFLFAFANLFKYQLGIDLGFVTVFVEWLMSLDAVPVVNWIIRILLLGGPVLAVLINLFAITHFYTDRELKEFIVTFKLKWSNIAVILFCGFILMVFLLYLVSENLIEMR